MRQLLIAISAMRGKEFATSADCRCTSGSVLPSLCCSGGRPAKRRKRTFLHIANHHSTMMPRRNAGEKSPEGRNSAPKLRCSESVSNGHLPVNRALSPGLMLWGKSSQTAWRNNRDSNPRLLFDGCITGNRGAHAPRPVRLAHHDQPDTTGNQQPAGDPADPGPSHELLDQNYGAEPCDPKKIHHATDEEQQHQDPTTAQTIEAVRHAHVKGAAGRMAKKLKRPSSQVFWRRR